jgi:hypothetical protein
MNTKGVGIYLAQNFSRLKIPDLEILNPHPDIALHCPAFFATHSTLIMWSKGLRLVIP